MGFGPEIILAKGSMLAWGTQKSLKTFQVGENSSSRAEWCVCLNGFWALWGIFYLDRHFKPWNLVQEVVSEALLNNVVDTDYSHEKNPQASLACFCMEAVVIQYVCISSHPKKLVPENRSFVKTGSTIKGGDHRSNLVVGEDSSWVCILLDMKEPPPSIWQQMHQNCLLRDESVWNWLCESCFSYSYWDYSGVQVEVLLDISLFPGPQAVAVVWVVSSSSQEMFSPLSLGGRGL